MKLSVITGKIGSGKSTILSSIRDLGGVCYSMDELSNIVLQVLLVEEVLAFCGDQAVLISDNIQISHVYQSIFEAWKRFPDENINDFILQKQHGQSINLTKRLATLKALTQRNAPLPPIIDKKKLTTAILDKPFLLQQLEDMIYPITLRLALHYLHQEFSLHRTTLYLEHPLVKLDTLLNELQNVLYRFFIIEINANLRKSRLHHRNVDTSLLQILEEKQDTELSVLLQRAKSQITRLHGNTSSLSARQIISVSEKSHTS
ncbi:Putative dephospho-CoA kinase [Candidatus Fokinia solitaria]|uniref:Dephospho-CoA kinase n=1 Tax=Candidatus Fokinia solitaria TaxID=1802984 RepID=A0A2U8BRM3_9RICK|nr:hypothetical protein [Candidatus Fokinia solitaria]AWD33006.1 Putative dephospho-CoA kinase [Candidatus Fokinia solitaria]